MGADFVICDFSDYGYDLQLKLSNIISVGIDLGVAYTATYLKNNPDKLEQLKNTAIVLRDACDCAKKNVKKMIRDKSQKLFIDILEEKQNIMNEYIEFLEDLKSKNSKK